jgi:hypothetical protein
MRLKPKTLIIAAGIILAAFIPLFIFNARSPVLIVIEQSFIELYGKERLNNEAFFSSLVLFRSVKTVAVANDAGDDIVPFAVTEISSSPYCVLFPLRFARSALLYRNLAPNIPVVVLEGRYPEDENPADSVLGEAKHEFFIYKTDINDDFYKAGLAVTALKPLPVQNDDNSTIGESKKGKIVVFLDQNMNQMRDVFLRGLYDRGNLLETHFFNSFSQYSEQPDLNCVVMTGLGAEFLDKKTGVPVISFTWLNPFLLPSDVVMVINDSPLIQARQAVKMVSADIKRGLIKSGFFVLNRKKFDRGVIAIIRKNS